MKRHYLTHWLPLFVWMGMIFILSSQPKNESAQLSGWVLSLLRGLGLSMETITAWNLGFYVRKLAHFTEYLILFLFARRVALYYALPMGYTWLFCVLYSASDEWHQSFVPGRVAVYTDVLIDSAGALAGLGLALTLQRIRWRNVKN